MVVRTQENGRENIGLHVGAANARRYFPKNLGAVELRFGDLQIQCKLGPAFWDGQPEIHDPRLCEWLKFKLLREQSDRKPVTFAMVQSGRDSFILQPIPAADRRSARLTSAA